MKIPDPNNPVFIQKNNGVRDRTANIAGTMNIDFSRYPGKAIPAPRLKQITTQSEVSNLREINSFAYYSSDYYAPSRAMLTANEIVNAWSEVSGGPSWVRDVYSDAVTFNNQLVVSLTAGGTVGLPNADIAMFNGSTWNETWFTGLTGGTGLINNVAHPMAVVQIGSPTLCIGNGNTMSTVIGTTATHPRLTLDNSQRIRWIVGGTSRAYIGCMNIREPIGGALVYEWDGGDTVPTRAYRLTSGTAMAGVMDGDTLYVLDGDGSLLRLEGGGFVRVAEFPIFKDRRQPEGWDPQNLNAGFAGHRGMCMRNGKVLINIVGQVSGGADVPEYSMSGTWEFDPQTGSLSHKYAPTIDKTGSLDFGQRFSRDPGAIFEARHPDGGIVVSNKYWTGSGGTDVAAIYVDDISGGLPRRGRLITQQIDSPALTNQWKLRLKYGLMKNAGDRIVLKYRVNGSGELPFTGTVTWVSSTQFTSTTPNFQHVVVGDEIEVVRGKGGGCTAHVTAISESSGTYTVTLSETIIGVAAADTALVRAHNWKFVESFNDQTLGYRDITILSRSSTWIQVVVELRSAGGDSPMLEEIDIVPTKQQ